MQDFNLATRRGFASLLSVSLLVLAGCGGGGGDDTSITGTPDPDPGSGVSDTIAPQVAILTPDDDGDAVVNQTTVTLSGQASDNVGVSSLTWQNNRGGQGTIPVSASWISDSITLSQGENVITVTAKDSADNESSATITIMFNASAGPSGDATFMVSSQPDYSNPIMVTNATLQPQMAYFFLEPAPGWSTNDIDRVEFECCADSGNGSGVVAQTVEQFIPYELIIDLSQFASGSQREISATVFFNDGSTVSASTVFSIGTSTGPSNNAPVISGNPSQSVTVGQTYNFVPSASDADGDPLTFSIVNQPSWANFNQATGQLTGAPDSNDVGTYSGIRISVTDGEGSDELGPFSITVGAVATSAMTINWTPPTTRTDGTPLVGLTAYRIFFGTQPGVYPDQVYVNDGGLTAYTIDNIAPGTYYVAMKAVDSYGLESALSNEVVEIAP